MSLFCFSLSRPLSVIVDTHARVSYNLCRKEYIMELTILGFRVRIYKDPKVPKQVYIYITSRDGTTFYVLIQDMGKNVK